jgi:hypothetical protein
MSKGGLMLRQRLMVGGALGAALCCMAAGAAPAGAAPAKVRTVVTGLDNPRDLAFGPGRRLYVAEAGHGGPRCVSSPEFGSVCFGFSSGISRIDVRHGSARRVVSGLVSNAGRDGSFATGIDGISFGPGRTVYGIITGATDAIPPGAFPAAFERRVKAQIGRLIAVHRGAWRPAGNVGHRDWVWSLNHKNLVPGQFPDANPYGVVSVGRVHYVVDAATNTIDRVDRSGRVHVRKFIPNPPASDSVPTCIDRGPDGALYVGELTGGGNTPGAARVWRYVPRTNGLSLWARGLTAVTGCGFDRHGRFYAVEFSTNGLDAAAPGTGALVRVPPHSRKPVTVVGGLNFPGGFAAGPRGALYLSNWSVAPAHSTGFPSGEVLQVLPRS